MRRKSLSSTGSTIPFARTRQTSRLDDIASLVATTLLSTTSSLSTVDITHASPRCTNPPTIPTRPTISHSFILSRPGELSAYSFKQCSPGMDCRCCNGVCDGHSLHARLTRRAVESNMMSKLEYETSAPQHCTDPFPPFLPRCQHPNYPLDCCALRASGHR